MPIQDSAAQVDEPSTAVEKGLRQRADPLGAEDALPQNDESDSIKLLAQSPEKIFLYWQHARTAPDTLRKAFGEEAASYDEVVRLLDVESGETTIHAASAGRAQWFDVLADRAYRAEVGFAAPARPFIRLLSSDVVRTPHRNVSRRADRMPEFRIPSADFARLLSEAGYAEDAAAVAREASVEMHGAEHGAEYGAEATHERETRSAWNASDVNLGASTFAGRRPSSFPQMF